MKNLIFFINKIFIFFFKKNIFYYFKNLNDLFCYTELEINKKKYLFFTPNNLVLWRVKNYECKEPEILAWIDKYFSKNSIYFDIGANIGLYSIYPYIRKKNKIKTFAFEPSPNNLRILSRNISINNLQNNIKILPIALGKQPNKFPLIYEKSFLEGSSQLKFEFLNKQKNKSKNQNFIYSSIVSSLDFLVKEKILPIPNFIKIDVDGLEYNILEGAKKILNNKNLKSLAIEIDEKEFDVKNKIIELMKKNNFKFHVDKKRNIKSKQLNCENIFNYFFFRK